MMFQTTNQYTNQFTNPEIAQQQGHQGMIPASRPSGGGILWTEVCHLPSGYD